MIKESLRDIPSDEDVSSGEDDPSVLVREFIHVTESTDDIPSTFLLNIDTYLLYRQNYKIYKSDLFDKPKTELKYHEMIQIRWNLCY